MVYNQDFTHMSAAAIQQATNTSAEAPKNTGNPQSQSNKKNEISKVNATLKAILQRPLALDKAINNIFTYGATGCGEYIYVKLPDKQGGISSYQTLQIDDAAIAGRDANGKPNPVTDPKDANLLRLVFPASDESGYEHIGNYQYGRGLQISGGGIRKVSPTSASLSLSQASSISSDTTQALQSAGSVEGFLTMTPTLDSSQAGFANNQSNNDLGTGLGYVKQDAMSVDIDSVSVGVSLAAMAPGGANSTQCVCNIAEMASVDGSQAKIDMLTYGLQHSDTGQFNTANLNDFFESLYNDSMLSDHAAYEDSIKKG
jgi:hypothetical protein